MLVSVCLHILIRFHVQCNTGSLWQDLPDVCSGYSVSCGCQTGRVTNRSGLVLPELAYQDRLCDRDLMVNVSVWLLVLFLQQLHRIIKKGLQ